MKDFCKSLFFLTFVWLIRFVNFLPFSFLVWSGILCAVHWASSTCAEVIRSAKQVCFWINCQSWIQRLMSIVCVLYIIYQTLRSFLRKFPLSSLSVYLSVCLWECVCVFMHFKWSGCVRDSRCKKVIWPRNLWYVHTWRLHLHLRQCHHQSLTLRQCKTSRMGSDSFCACAFVFPLMN